MDPPAPRHLRLENNNGVSRITFPEGQARGDAVREMYEAAMRLIDHRDARLLVDFTGVNMVSSGTMGMLTMIRKKFLACGAQLHVAIPDTNVMQAFELMNLNRLLHLFTDPDEAIARFK